MQTIFTTIVNAVTAARQNLPQLKLVFQTRLLRQSLRILFLLNCGSVRNNMANFMNVDKSVESRSALNRVVRAEGFLPLTQVSWFRKKEHC